MKIKSLIITIASIVVVVVATNVIYNVTTKLKQEHQAKKAAKTASEAPLTPLENQIDSSKSQLMFLQHDQIQVTAVNQNILYNVQNLLGGKATGNIKIDVSKAKELLTDINNYWSQNDKFSTQEGVALGKEYAAYMNQVDTYLQGGIKTGYLNAAQMPKFPSSDMDAITNQINNIELNLIALENEQDPGSAQAFSTSS